MAARRAGMLDRVPQETLDWLLSEENPAIAVLTRRRLLGETQRATADLWARRNEYAPVARILDAMGDDGTWSTPERDYQKYGGNLWQVHFLGELWADGSDERVRRAADYAFSRQLEDGSWSSNGRPYGSAPCLTANVARALARLGYARDERIAAALGYCVDLFEELGAVSCRGLRDYMINGYCHMLTPKTLLFLAEVPESRWPDGARALRDACVDALDDKEIFRSLPAGSRDYQALASSTPKAEIAAVRERWVAENSPLEYGEKKGWLRFGYPLSYNSDVLEALAALAGAGEPMRPAFADALAAVESAADEQMRWTLRNSFNGKMLADVEVKGEPSRWLTLRALLVLEAFAA